MKALRSPPAPMPSRPNSPSPLLPNDLRRRLRPTAVLFPQPHRRTSCPLKPSTIRVPLGSLVRYFDGTPRPPERFKRKLAAWENNNNGGRLVRKSAPHTVGTHTTPASVTLHQGDFGSAGVIVLKVFKTFSVNSPLTFTVIERPKAWNSARSQSRRRRCRTSASRRHARRRRSVARIASLFRRRDRRGLRR